ncbi:MAG: sigma-70 family RNA polymerase sigma factor [Phycisphaerae bacterium]|nr:sigma-70 family RNA polymerase sigma factor [Phycisphaerae bacterium]
MMTRENTEQKISKLVADVEHFNLSTVQKKKILNVIERPMYHIEDAQFNDRKKMDRCLEQKFNVLPPVTLSSEDTMTLFLQLNYSRFKINQLRDLLLQAGKIGPKALEQMLLLYDRQLDARSQIATGNMGLVLAMAKQSSYPGIEFTDMISEGSMALLRSIDKFDYNRGFKFSTYSCRAIKKSFSRIARQYYRYRNLFSVQLENNMEPDHYQEHLRECVHHDHVDDVKSIFLENIAELTRTERKVVMLRFSLEDDTANRMTLKQVGQQLSLSKERIRQIQNKALEKIRAVAYDRLSMMS